MDAKSAGPAAPAPSATAPRACLTSLAILAAAAMAAMAAVAAHAASAAGGRGAVPDAGKTGKDSLGHGPVVVELFTSQGCSSCPPADRLLSRLKRDPRLAGAVIPLAFHVDYWNHLGWSDPFSSHLWSQRQMGYAQAFHSNRVYTPQLVVNGRTECVGSEEAEVMRRIRQAQAAEPVGEVTLSAPAAPAAPEAGGSSSARIAVTARLLQPMSGPGLDVWVALTESGLTTAVGAGENASATLHNDQVVRRLVKAFSLPATAATSGGAPGTTASKEITLPLDAGWNRAALDVVAFLQDPRSLAIDGAASLHLTAR